MIKALSITFAGWVIAIFMTVVSLQGCIQDDCGPFPAVDFNSITNQIYHVRLDSQKGTFNQLFFKSSREYAYNEVGFELVLQGSQISFSYYGFSSLMACSPPRNFAEIKSFMITSNNQYDEYGAGTDLTDIFSIQEVYYSGEISSIPKYLANNQNRIFGFEPYLLVINQPPSIKGSHQFTIQLELSDGTLLETTTDKVSIT